MESWLLGVAAVKPWQREDCRPRFLSPSSGGVRGVSSVLDPTRKRLLRPAHQKSAALALHLRPLRLYDSVFLFPSVA